MRQDLRIIVEGMDGTGKTYLIDRLTDRFNQLYRVINTKGPDQNFDVWWPEQLDIEKSEAVPIHDRFYYSELIYGTVLRGYIAASPGVMNNVTWFLRTTSLLIYARPPVGVIRERIRVNPQMDGVHGHFERLLELYDQTMMGERSWFGPRFVHYTAESESEILRVGDIVGAYLGANP